MILVGTGQRPADLLTVGKGINAWLVDEADTVLALWSGKVGGTSNCIDYARKQGVQIINLYSAFEKHSGPSVRPPV